MLRNVLGLIWIIVLIKLRNLLQIRISELVVEELFYGLVNTTLLSPLGHVLSQSYNIANLDSQLPIYRTRL